MRAHFSWPPALGERLAWSALGLALLLNLLFFFTAVSGARQEAQRSLAEIARLQRKPVEKARPQAESPAEQAAARRLQRFMEHLPDRSGLARQVGALEALLQRHNLAAGGIALAPEKSESAQLAKYSATLSAGGTYAAVRAFLAELQNSPQLFCIQNLSLKRESARSKGVTLQLGLGIYLRPAPSGAAAAQLPPPAAAAGDA
jgi:hypothetical protein